MDTALASILNHKRIIILIAAFISLVGAPTVLMASRGADEGITKGAEGDSVQNIDGNNPVQLARENAIAQTPIEFFSQVESISTFAGSFTDHLAGTLLVVRATGDFQQFERIASRYSSADREIVIRPAEYTWSELLRLRDEITSASGELRAAGLSAE